MIEINSFQCLNISELLKIYSENELACILNRFKCNKNSEIDTFLKNSAIDFNKKSQAITYLIFDCNDKLMGYFSLSLKPIMINSVVMSKSDLKKVLRISDLELDNNTVSPASYLIAQLGKDDRSSINIDIIFDFINYFINEAKNICGGVVEFLESENSVKLIDMYKDRGFKTFNTRKSKSGEDRKLVQMYRLI